MKPGRLRAVRWTQLAIVFQGALHTLNPVQRVGRQIGEAIELHHRRCAAAGLRARGRAARARRAAGARARRLPAPALRRPAPARADRARARVQPRLLIADEPTTALDVMVQAQVLRLLEELQRDLGLAVLFITHDLSTLAAVVPSGSRSCTRGGSSRRDRARGVRLARASLHGGARRGVPGDRRSGASGWRRPASGATRPTRASCRPAVRSTHAAPARGRRVPDGRRRAVAGRRAGRARGLRARRASGGRPP